MGRADGLVDTQMRRPGSHSSEEGIRVLVMTLAGQPQSKTMKFSKDKLESVMCSEWKPKTVPRKGKAGGKESQQHNTVDKERA